MSDELFISIITPSLNREAFIAEAIESVLQQDYPFVEHIIMDGGSTDRTLEILSHYPQLKVISQPDEGLYDAINKGLGLVSGEIIGLLNTDDYYEPNIFGDVIQLFKDNPTIDALSGGANLVQEIRGKREILVTSPCIYRNNLLKRATQGEANINAWFFRKQLFNKIGGFSLHYRYAADREFLIRLAREHINLISFNRAIYNYRRHPNSLTQSSKNQGEADFTFENRQLAESYLADKNISAQDRQIFRTWHAHITIDQAISAFQVGAFDRVASYVQRGLQFNPFWPVLFFFRFLWRTTNFAKWRTIRFLRDKHKS